MVVAILLGVLATAGASSPAIAHDFSGRYADSSLHTWWNGSARSYDVPVWGPMVADIMDNEIERKTAVRTAKVSYHYRSGLRYPYVDISWWADDLPAPKGGKTTCERPLSGSACDHWHVVFDDDPGQPVDGKRQKVCHEILHTLGADDGSNDGGCIGGGPEGKLNAHDIAHINGKYGR